MREIRFKAYDAKGNYTADGEPGMLKDITGKTYFDHVWHDDDFVKLQWTGLFDANDTPIYEGDIIQYDNERYEVYWSEDWAMFAVKGCQIQPLMRYATCAEIIGNVFQHPWLLKKEG